MKQSEALIHLREFMLALQRHRSIVMESLGPGTGELHLTEKFAAELWPWIWGDKCPLQALAKIVTRAEDGGKIVPMDYYNMMFVLQRFTPEVKAMVDMRLSQAQYKPILDELELVQILSGWEPE